MLSRSLSTYTYYTKDHYAFHVCSAIQKSDKQTEMAGFPVKLTIWAMSTAKLMLLAAKLRSQHLYAQQLIKQKKKPDKHLAVYDVILS